MTSLIMPLKKLKNALQSLRSLYSSGKEKGGKPFWKTILKKFKSVSGIAKSSEWQSIEDACQIGEDLVNKISSEEISDDPKIYQHFESLLKVFDDLYSDIESNGQITISVKGRLARIKMFIGDFVNVSEEPKETCSTEDSGFSIDVMHELNSRVENMERLILGIKGSHIEPEAINGLFREFHTLKGESGFLGFENLGNFCHRVEAILEPLRDTKVFVTQEIIDILLFCVDKTKLLILNTQSTEDSSADDGTDEKLSALVKLIQERGDKPTETLRQAQGDTQKAQGDTQKAQSDTQSTVSLPDHQSDVTETKTEEKGKEPTTEFAEVFPLDDEGEEGDAPTVSSPETEETQPVEKEIQGGAKKEDEESRDEIVDAGIKAQNDDQSVFLNVETEKVDFLINITGELTILYHMLQQSPEIRRIKDQKITNNIEMMGRFFKELQNIAISIRTVSIQPLFLKMARLARELGRKSNKSVKVTIAGEAAHIDKSLINQLAGPLAHIIRNCLDHGMELPHERIEAGKNEAGLIKLEAKKRGNNTLIEISDDGRGISYDRIESKAKELGLVDPKKVLTDEEKHELLFKPGLSTASKVTRTSGRGVGMDVIRTEVQKAKGILDVKTEVGKGTTISLLFPQTFAITDGLVVRVKKNFFVIPIEQVREMSQFDPSKLETVNNKSKIILIRGHYIPVIELESFLNIKSNGSKDSGDQIMVTVENDDKRCVLLVDEVTASQEVVVKELTGSFTDLPYFTGTAILGNKGVGIILDIAKITETYHSFMSEKDMAASSRDYDDDRINVVDIGTNTVAMIDFFVETAEDRFDFAINAFKTREFIHMDTYKTTPLPNAPNGFEGIITLREKTLPIFNLAKLLAIDSDGSRPQDKIAIVCEFAKKTVAFLVTGVSKVNYISWKEILPPPKTSGKISLENITGIILKKKSGKQNQQDKSSGDITFVLDFEKMLNDIFPLYESLDDKLKIRKGRKASNVILLVEDSAIMRSKMKEAMEAGGITVIEAENGQEALDIVNKYFNESKEKNGSIFDYLDLVICDIEMPQLDGYTFTKTIKSHPELRVLPVLLHSSLSNETIVKRAKEVNADGFIAKCDPDLLLKALEKYL